MATKQLILVVEDDTDIRELLRFQLESEGFAVVTADDGAPALAAVEQHHPALVLLDLMLPGMPGVEVCKRLRASSMSRHLPIIMVTARGSETDRVVGLELGADDYIVKPFSIRELIARIRAVLRRTEPRATELPPHRYEKGRLKLDFDTYECFVDGRPLVLSLREFQLLKFFVCSPNRVYDRLQLLDLVWGSDIEVESRTVDVHVRRLRQHIEKDDAHPELILTVRGVGYKFNERALEE